MHGYKCMGHRSHCTKFIACDSLRTLKYEIFTRTKISAITNCFYWWLVFFRCFVVCSSDSSWGEWGEWGACDVSCGYGRQFRNRTCGGVNATGSESCRGNSSEQRTCKEEACVEGRNKLPLLQLLLLLLLLLFVVVVVVVCCCCCLLLLFHHELLCAFRFCHVKTIKQSFSFVYFGFRMVHGEKICNNYEKRSKRSAHLFSAINSAIAWSPAYLTRVCDRHTHFFL